MKKNTILSGAAIVFFVGLLLLLNLQVTTNRGINYKEYSIKIPLYLKMLDFVDRHYNYAVLTKKIINQAKTDEERVMKIFQWTHENLKRPVSGLPIIDDHVWYTIVRGYGARDQFSDVFTTLCNYAGVDAFFTWVYSKDKASRVPLSFVKIKGKWCVFDPCQGVYFKNKQGELADISILKSGEGWTMSMPDRKSEIDYTVYLANLSSIKEIGYRRANLQSPLRRLLFEIKKIKK